MSKDCNMQRTTPTALELVYNFGWYTTKVGSRLMSVSRLKSVSKSQRSQHQCRWYLAHETGRNKLLRPELETRAQRSEPRVQNRESRTRDKSLRSTRSQLRPSPDRESPNTRSLSILRTSMTVPDERISLHNANQHCCSCREEEGGRGCPGPDRLQLSSFSFTALVGSIHEGST